MEIRKPTLPVITTRSKLTDFVEPRSILLFALLGVDHTFLLQNHWSDTQEFLTCKEVETLRPINDSSERALTLATTFTGKRTQDGESFQELVLVVEKHRKLYGFKTKKDLKNFM